MLIKFKVSNYLSFNETVEFNMLAGNVRRHSQHIHNFKGHRLLKSSVVYGSNGSGKSNLIHAMGLLEEIVAHGELNSFTDNNKFKLNPSNLDLPIKLEIEFITNNRGYSYGIEFHENLIKKEWLKKLEFGKKDDLILFRRESKSNDKIKLTFADKYLKSEKNKVLREVYQDDLLTKDLPFIFLAKTQKFKEISEAYEWITNKMVFIFTGVKFRGLAGIMNRDIEFRDFTNKLIGDLGTGIKELRIKTIDFDSYFGEDNLAEKERVLKSVMDGEEEMIGDYYSNAIAYLDDNGKPIVKKLYSIHESPDYGEIEFELYEESEGSLRLLDFLPAFHMALNYEYTIIIDEIDQSIHVNLLKELVSKLQEKGDLKGQIIFTTHESNLLDLDIFRQDEIWFTEKDIKGATHLCQLSDFDIRTEMDVTKGYLSGKFGAIPFLGNFKDFKKIENKKKPK